MSATVAKQPKQPKRIEEVVQFALGHRTRVLILIVLNDGTYTAVQLAEIIGEPLNNVANHLRKMLDDGSIEVANEERKGNVVQYSYRAVEIPFYSQKAAEEMTTLQRQMTVGAIVQSGMAELMAAFYAWKLTDPRTVLFWDWFHVDPQGRTDMETENVRYLERLREIEVESTNRRAKSGEDSESILVNLSVFERVRKDRDLSSSS